MMRDFDKKLYPNTYNYVKDNIVEGVRCNRCGTPVLISEVEGYTYQCMHCDEDLSTFETYKSSDTYSADEFNDICNDTLAELLLDEERSYALKCFRVYSRTGNRLEESFKPSTSFDNSEINKNDKVIVYNADITKTHAYSILYIIKSNEVDIYAELHKQLTDGLFKKSNVDRIEEVYSIRDGLDADFYNDKDKMRDFVKLSKSEFLRSYSYITEKAYDNTISLTF